MKFPSKSRPYTTARLAHYLADAITAGDIGGIFVTAAKIAAATALVVIENIIDIYAFIDGYTGGAEQSIANANVKVLLGMWVDRASA